MNDFSQFTSSGFNRVGPLALLALIVLLMAGIWFSWSNSSNQSNESADSNAYQAIFLANGNIYFGKLSVGSEHYILSDIFYLQTSRPLQPKEGQDKSETKLIKFGDEIHGPEDIIYFNKSQVLYWENLKDGGRVVTAIKAHKAKSAATAAPAPTPTPAP